MCELIGFANVMAGIQLRVAQPLLPRYLAVIFWFAAFAAVEAAAEPTIVVAGPATGRHAELLPQMLSGARQSIRGAGEQVLIEDEDDGCDAGRAEGTARLIAARKPALVIGHPCPAAAIAAARVYAAHSVLFIALGVRHPELTDKRAGTTVFRLAGRDDRQGLAAAEELARMASGGSVAIVQDRTAYARGLTKAVTAELAGRGVGPPVVVPIVAGRRDYDAELKPLIAAPPSAVFFAGYPSEAVVILRGLAKAGLKSAFLASDANTGSELAQVAADSAGKEIKVMVKAPGSGGLDGPELGEAAARAVTAWLQARKSGGAESVARALVATDGAGAPLFDANGDARAPSYVAVGVSSRKSAEAGP